MILPLRQSKLARFLFSDTRCAALWLVARVYVGWQWLEAGWGKIHNPLWVGPDAGMALQGFLKGALVKTTGAHPDVSSGYAYFIEHVALQHTTVFSYLVSFGEVAVGLGLIFGLATGIAAFFGAMMNFNFLFSGAISVNPQFILIEIFLVLAWRTAGWYGLDRFVEPFRGARLKRKKVRPIG